MPNFNLQPRDSCHTGSLRRKTGAGVLKDLCDADIREPLNAWLSRRHRSNTSIIQEFKMPRPSARIDVAVVNGKMIGFEIKSDVDTLARLRAQMRAYEQVFDEICVVTTERHLEKVLRLVPTWCGVVVPKQSRRTITFKSIQVRGTNPSSNTPALLHTLSRAELKKILSANGLSKGCSAKRKDEIIGILIERVRDKRLRSEARHLLRMRET